ncbi:hypothetical protein FH972_025020 [Carpinus fangiana]|uniref:Pre-mRNA 3'-end-processing endonuclease polyadenylation factor C-term domain-containing protein n=1 Tax=Carpinus fangiana TaxID=176857 RepID=A0A5N6L045_9ROSI|nr:hypothetical protein FH972_025020 [Carpinus fangiana]
MDTVSVTIRPRGALEIEWEGNVMNDGIADAVMAVLLAVESAPASVRRSTKLHSHSHAAHDHALTNGSNGAAADPPPRNPHAAAAPAERLSRLLLFLEAQFGADAIEPVAEPRPTATATDASDGTVSAADSGAAVAVKASAAEQALPAPGLKIRVDRHVATVWLEDLSVECASAPLRDRVRAVVERGVECVAPLWSGALGGAAVAV